MFYVRASFFNGVFFNNIMKKILVSSCLIGKKCAYDGLDRLEETVKDLCVSYGYIDVCPEVEGGLGCPRERHEICGGDGSSVLDKRASVLSGSGEDRTEEFISGAYKALEKAYDNSIEIAILKEKSPSCGKYNIHAGKFDGTLKPGSGVTGALLMRKGIKVFTETEVELVRKQLKEHEV